jgi:hypothetical protein
MLSRQKEATFIKSMKDFDCNAVNKQMQINKYITFCDAQLQFPHLSQKEICKKINISSSTIYRIRQDLEISSPYRYKVPLHKNRQSRVKDDIKSKNFECDNCHKKYVTEQFLEKHKQTCLVKSMENITIDRVTVPVIKSKRGRKKTNEFGGSDLESKIYLPNNDFDAEKEAEELLKQ